MRFSFIVLITMLTLYACKDRNSGTTSAEPIVKKASTTAPWEPGNTKLTDIGKQQLREFEQGNIQKWSEAFADNAVYNWSSGDSLTGKAAITDYWQKRRTEVIDKISFTNDIWIPIKINQPQHGPDAPGDWLLNWYQVDVTYKNGKQLNFWVHTDFHFNDENKIDRAVQYIDRAPINAALGK